MLADMYLWRGNVDDYDKCIEVCEAVTRYKTDDYFRLEEEQGDNCIVKLFNGYPLISDAPANKPGESFNEIFGIGGSFESLFELSFDYAYRNQIGLYYYNSTYPVQVQAFPGIGYEFSSYRGNEVFEQPQDTRFYHNVRRINSGYWAISKYAYSWLQLKIYGSEIEYDRAAIRGGIEESNWIVYRYTEVLLFEAEAYVMKAIQNQNDSVKCIEYKDKAFNLIDAVNKRSIVADKEGFQPVTLTQLIGYSTNTTVNELENVLFKERRRELMFEGKRWFDLLRMARRDGNQKRLFQFVEKKYDTSTVSAIRIRFNNPNALYFPLYEDEIINSQGVLEQNHAYKDE